MSLAEKKCEACQSGAPKIEESEIPKLLEAVPGWAVEDRDGVLQLKRVYKFKNFKLAMAFANRVGDVAEEEFHHPGVLVEWGRVTVTWWSHSIEGLHLNDFIMAAKTDAVLEVVE